MSTEGKIAENPETVEPPKPKRRLKLDKKRIQGFIAGILFCAIAFTGLYYGTDGRFFTGMVSGKTPVITDADFKGVLEQPDRYIIVASSNYYGNYRGPDHKLADVDWQWEVQSLDTYVNELKRYYNFDNDKVILVELNPDQSMKVIKEHFPMNTHFVVFYNGKEIVTSRNAGFVRSWFDLRAHKRLL